MSVLWFSLMGLFAAGVVWGVLFESSDRRRIAERRRASGAEIETLRRRKESMTESALRLVATNAPVFSKIGGLPETPPGLIWPVGPAGPLDFLLQVDLAAARAAGGPAWLPPAGSLYLFGDEQAGFAENAWGIFEPPGPRASLSPPPGVDPYAERRVAFEQRTVQPDFYWLGEDFRRWPREFWAPGPPRDPASHQIGGYPDQIQTANIPLICEQAARNFAGVQRASVKQAEPSQSWRLLAQIDSDDDLGMNWGDTGTVYVMVRTAQALAGDFSEVVVITQTY
ncbi:DUF1963 domain-containing protein [Phenylobacterium aquaticum]|uniref:DUF1963 domain-containing protein n=1 Tax=Phenylobacterium aquaticum TaxID=1763816 RepID=UPI0026F0CB80|nr:DUF1963 domain-containing protein [Phenylobacterium aquaticum]